MLWFSVVDLSLFIKNMLVLSFENTISTWWFMISLSQVWYFHCLLHNKRSEPSHILMVILLYWIGLTKKDKYVILDYNPNNIEGYLNSKCFDLLMCISISLLSEYIQYAFIQEGIYCANYKFSSPCLFN